MNGDGVIGQFSKAVVQFEEVLFLSASLLRGSSQEQAKGVMVFDTAQEMTLTIARLHALRIAVLLRVPGDGSHVGHVVTLGVGVGRVRWVARHIRGGRVVLWSRRMDWEQWER